KSITSRTRRFGPWTKRIVPQRAGALTTKFQLFEFSIFDFDLLVVRAAVELHRDLQSGLRSGVADVTQQSVECPQGNSPPVLADGTEQAMLYRIPLRGPTWEMSDRNGQAGLVGEALQLALPQSDAAAVAATRV